MTLPRCRGIEMQENFLALEPLIVARLKEQLADITPKVHVLTAFDLAGVEESKQFTPAVHVIFGGYAVVSTPRSDGRAVRVSQKWIACPVVRNVHAARSGMATREDAGTLAQRVFQALLGFKPCNDITALQASHAPSGSYTPGFFYLPLAFTVELNLTNI